MLFLLPSQQVIRPVLNSYHYLFISLSLLFQLCYTSDTSITHIPTILFYETDDFYRRLSTMPTLTIDVSALKHNTHLIQKLAANAAVIAVLKNNGYGLGLVPFASFLQEEGISHFAVTELCDALALRGCGIRGHILLLTPLYEFDELIDAIQNNIELCISGPASARAAQDAAIYMNCSAVPVQLCIDTGFGRFGFSVDNVKKIQDTLETMSCLKLCGIFSHLYASACKNSSAVRKQFSSFERLCTTLTEQGVSLGMRHISSSSSLLRFPEMNLDGVRIGSAFLGRLAVRDSFGFQEVCCLRALISEIRTLPMGHNVGYGNSFRLKHPTITAVTDAGYAHGLGMKHSHFPGNHVCPILYILRRLRQSLTIRAPFARYQNRKFPVLGQICMNSTILDATGCHLQVGDTVSFPVNPVYVDSRIKRNYLISQTEPTC